MATDSLLRRLGSSLKSALFDEDEDLFDGESTGIAVWDDDVDATIDLSGIPSAPSGKASARSLELIWRSALRALPEDGRSWPRSNPAFTETLFTELLKLGQVDRAFALLAQECQDAWGSAARFGKTAGGSSMSGLGRCTIRSCRFAVDWSAPLHESIVFPMVAELEVAYEVDVHGMPRLFTKTVHLAAQSGSWKCVYFPRG